MTENEEKCETKCKRCGTYRFPSQFFNEKGRSMKSCQVCRDKAKISRGKNKCPHSRQKNKCKECGGVSICEHNRIHSKCKECGGASVCPHRRQKAQCKECRGSQICEHNRIHSYCKDCMNDEEKIEFIKKRMISHSREKDKKHNLYDADNFIDMCFLTGLFEDTDTSCHYCSVEFTYNEVCDTFVTIERLNNNIGHIKSNCVLACLSCNRRHNDKDDIRE